MTVTINQVNKYNGEIIPVVNLAEVQLFSKGIQIPPSQLTFTLSSTLPGNPVSNCNDGVSSNFCHTNVGDNSPTLTIYSPYAIDQIVVTNRPDCCQFRIAAATISVSQPGAQLWQSTFIGTQNVYAFNIGKSFYSNRKICSQSIPFI